MGLEDFLLIFVICVLIIAVFSKSRWVLSSSFGKFWFVTYYQFDFDNTVCCLKLKKKDEHESTQALLSKAQFGYVLKDVNDPSTSQFHMVAIHQGPLNKNTQSPLLSYEQYLVQCLLKTKTPNSMLPIAANQQIPIQRDIMHTFVNTCVVAMQSPKPKFTDSFEFFFAHLLQDPNARITFHVFDIEHLHHLNVLLSSHKLQFYMTHFLNDTKDVLKKTEPFYVPITLEETQTNVSSSFLSFCSSSSHDNGLKLIYEPLVHYSQQTVFKKQQFAQTINIFREDKERFDMAGQNPLFGKHSLSTLNWFTAFKIVRWVVFDDELCWNMRSVCGKFVHVNSIATVNSNIWFAKHGQPNSVFCCLGFWVLSFCFACVYWSVFVLFGWSMIVFFNFLTYLHIDERRNSNGKDFCKWALLTQLPLAIRLWFL